MGWRWSSIVHTLNQSQSVSYEWFLWISAKMKTNWTKCVFANSSRFSFFVKLQANGRKRRNRRKTVKPKKIQQQITWLRMCRIIMDPLFSSLLPFELIFSSSWRSSFLWFTINFRWIYSEISSSIHEWFNVKICQKKMWLQCAVISLQSLLSVSFVKHMDLVKFMANLPSFVLHYIYHSMRWKVCVLCGTGHHTHARAHWNGIVVKK